MDRNAKIVRVRPASIGLHEAIRAKALKADLLIGTEVDATECLVKIIGDAVIQRRAPHIDMYLCDRHQLFRAQHLCEFHHIFHSDLLVAAKFTVEHLLLIIC